MKKVYQELQKVYKKANKESKLRIAKEWGCTTTAEFEAMLAKKLGTSVKGEAKKTAPKKTSKKKDIDTGSKVGDTIKVATPVAEAPKAESPFVEAEPINDIVIAFDTTGSMSRYIGAVKKHVNTLIPDLFAKMPNLRMKIVAFGDYCDMDTATHFGDAYQQSAFTNDTNALISFVQKARSTGGGDYEEFYELVIKKITEETPWREGSKRSVLLLADAVPHEVGYTYDNKVVNAQLNWREEAKKAAALGIEFDTMSMTGEKWYEELSRITNGIYAKFQSSEKTQEVLRASTLSRGGTMAKASYMASMDSAVKSGDEELTGLYKSFSSKL